LAYAIAAQTHRDIKAMARAKPILNARIFKSNKLLLTFLEPITLPNGKGWFFFALSKWFNHMDFNYYQRKAKKTDQRKNKKGELNRLIPLLGMIGEMGSVASEHKKRLRDGQSYTTFNEKFKKELGDVLWYISTLADDMDITLEDVAETNLAWTEERWDDLNNFLPGKLYDKGFPRHEQFPRKLTIQFKAIKGGKIAMFVNNVQLGDTINDNAHKEDGYRFHDVFHLAFMAILGWSPVIRALLKRKRKSKPKIDTVEDGARAIIIEEAISVMVYEHAKDHKFYKDIKVIDFDILNTIKGMVRNLESKSISSSLWEKAIIDGYSVYRKLKAKNGGKVHVNLNKREIKFLR
jgi:NTP pyrophosphatase (non-canonical NTP hydrolase)